MRVNRVFKSKTLLSVCLLLSAFITPVYAAEGEAVRTHVDGSVFYNEPNPTIKYDPSKVYLINAEDTQLTLLTFPDDEPVTSAITSHPNLWKVSVDGKFVYIQAISQIIGQMSADGKTFQQTIAPDPRAWATTLIVNTVKHVYTFNLNVKESDYARNIRVSIQPSSKTPTTKITLGAPKYNKPQTTTKAPARTKTLPKRSYQNHTPDSPYLNHSTSQYKTAAEIEEENQLTRLLPGSLWNYEIKGSKGVPLDSLEFTPRAVYSNGTFTYILFDQYVSVTPAVFIVDSSGREQLAQHDYAVHEDKTKTLILVGNPSKIRLKANSQAIEILNRNYFRRESRQK